MRSIRRTILSLVALIGLGAALGGCTTTERMLGTGAVIGVTAGATNALVREAMAAEYEPVGYRPRGYGYAGGLRPGMPCRYIDGRMGRLVFNPQSTVPSHLTCMCPPSTPYGGGYGGAPQGIGGGYINGFGAYGFPGTRPPMYGPPPGYRPPPPWMRRRW